MGLIKSIINAASGTLADQWIDFYTCDSLSSEVLMAVGTRPTQAKSGNTKYSENIITDGAKINVADGQCMLICENGKIVECTAEAGQYTYKTELQPTIMSGGLKDLMPTFSQVGKRFLAGGAPTDEQRIYYINIKEILGNKIGFANIPFRDSEFQFTMKVKGFGLYTFKITNPMLFYTALAGNVQDKYTKSALMETMKAEVMAAIQPALGKIAAKGIAYDQLINYPAEIGNAVDEIMSAKWSDTRGIDIISFAIESITVDEESAAKIAMFQEARVLSNAQMAAGRMVGSTAQALENAASNSAGAMTGFMGLGFAQNAGVGNVNNLFEMANQQGGAVPMPPSMETSNSWKCTCTAENTGAFCTECGSQKPVDMSWACTCGNANLGKFCSNCGNQKPAEAAQYKCDKCGWLPTNPTEPPKFCPECGDKFDNDDIVK